MTVPITSAPSCCPGVDLPGVGRVHSPECRAEVLPQPLRDFVSDSAYLDVAIEFCPAGVTEMACMKCGARGSEGWTSEKICWEEIRIDLLDANQMIGLDMQGLAHQIFTHQCEGGAL